MFAHPEMERPDTQKDGEEEEEVSGNHPTLRAPLHERRMAR